jgi:hypothetical protein
MNRRSKNRCPVRSRGVALLLVMIALAIASTLALTFVSAQSTTLGIARNLDRHAQARQVAEAGLEIAIREVRGNAAWRSERPYGAWVTDQPLSGGTFTVTGETDSGDYTSDPDEPLTLTSIGRFDGVSHRVRAVLWPIVEHNGAGGSGTGVLAGQSIELSGSSRVDSYNSQSGNYGVANVGSEALVVTNSTAPGAVKASGSAVFRGDILVGPGGDPDTVFSGYNWGTQGVTGSVGVADAPWTPTVPAHNIHFASAGNLSASGAPGWVHIPDSGSGGNLRHNNLSGGGSRKFLVHGDVRLRLDGDLSLGGNSGLELADGASLVVWVAGDVNIGGSANINANGRSPHRVIIYLTGDGSVSISGNTSVYATIIGPQAELSISGNSRLFGNFQGRKAVISGNSALHMDVSLQHIPGMVGGGGEAQPAGYRVRWIEGE